MAKKDKPIATVLAFEKKLVPSDGRFYGVAWENKYGPAAPLKLQEKSVRGTISNRLKKPLQDDPLKLDAEVEKPNLQTVDSCALGCDQDTLKLHFTLKILSGVEKPSACNSAEFSASYAQAAKAYIDAEGFTELAGRYAVNIANARFLWRNRVGAERIEVAVRVLNQGEAQSWVFDAKTVGTHSFDLNHADIAALAAKIAAALSGKTEFLLLEISAYAQIGLAQDVYPSEELVLDKGNSKSKKSKILYQIDGIAGMHSQKIGNALRTIDTWYPAHDDSQNGAGPIAIEPYGAVTSLGKAYRTPKEKADFYTLFDRFARGGKLDHKNDEHYVMAVLVRGGVFGESGKD
ncbi:type I-F CRISPR-associated protein Csy3 [Candidatus Methylospira mobilis]|uniref:type I-F CRISPR-associated protein Csy3 n=1 Tax=Candidatus Methylospira mobilis TaxID=1808979 RepID=UPI0028E8D1B7|nr:type I-F CRISPR-associated protein Csy3 [Candidatus Methylospira mobilis]WNV05622.1 type I-F CRISPR-associated protein Csy3 [Candidatus Methylospira mobilis]